MTRIPSLMTAVTAAICAACIAAAPIIIGIRNFMEKAGNETNPCQARKFRMYAYHMKWKAYSENEKRKEKLREMRGRLK